MDTREKEKEFLKYQDDLRDFINNPKSKMILDANHYYNGFGDPHKTKDAAFELTSGSYQSSFITLWELFDERPQFKECMEWFAWKARKIRRSNPYSSIIYCTATAKHIIDHVHSEIETEKERLNIFYLGPYPYLNPASPFLMDLRNERVLIMTDVLASGFLVKNLAEVVELLGGTSVAAICVVLAGEFLNNKLKENGPPITIDVGKEGKKKIVIHYLTNLEIPHLKESDFDKSKILKIDPVTVFPEERLDLPADFRIFFDDKRSFQHFEKSNAIAFNFFEMDFRNFTLSIRIDRLLDKFGKDIWKSIDPLFSRDKILVTTFSKEDIRFKEFVQDNLEGVIKNSSKNEQDTKRKIEYVYISKHDSLETPNSYFILPHNLKKLEGSEVILLLSSVNTSEKLRNLITLLAANSVRKITVICLLNRMGSKTTNFALRIKNLLRGVGCDPTCDAAFEFYSVYCISDLRSDDIAKIRKMAITLSKYYAKGTRVPSFRRWMNQEMKYFESISITSRSFVKGTPTVYESYYNQGGHSIKVKSLEGKLFLIINDLVLTRDYERLINEIREISFSNVVNKKILYKIFAILISDLNYLKMTEKFSQLRDTFFETIEDLRDKRFGLETSGSKEEVRKIVETETYLLLGLSFFSFLDQEFPYEPFIIKTITCGKSADDWIKSPVNLYEYFCNERVAWSISLLLIFSHHGIRHEENSDSFKREIIGKLISFLNVFQKCIPKSDRFNVRRMQKIKVNFNLILTELGLYDHRHNYEILRFLHSHIIYVKKGHSPIHSNLSAAIDALKALVDFGIDLPKAGEYKLDPYRKISVFDLKIMPLLEDAIYITGLLEDISNASRRMFDFTQSYLFESKRYVSTKLEPGFALDVIKLGDMLQKIRIDGSVSKKDLEILTELLGIISRDLWEDYLPLRKSLLSYIVPIESYILKGMTLANRSLSKGGFKFVWKKESLKYRKKGDFRYVLADPYLIAEILKNIFCNVQYNFEGYELIKDHNFSSLVSTTIDSYTESESESEELKFLELIVKSIGLPFRGLPDECTFKRHQSEIRKYGGFLEVKPLTEEPKKDEFGTIVTLKLVSRRNPTGLVS